MIAQRPVMLDPLMEEMRENSRIADDPRFTEKERALARKMAEAAMRRMLKRG